MTDGAGTPLNRYELVRGCRPVAGDMPTNAADNCYWNRQWYDEDRPTDPSHQAVLADNVAALAFFKPDAGSGGTFVYDSQTHSNLLPRYVDIYLELLPERAARQAALMMDGVGDWTNHVERHAERYTTRVFFRNREGYRHR
jgi:hypothetical protein